MKEPQRTKDVVEHESPLPRRQAEPASRCVTPDSDHRTGTMRCRSTVLTQSKGYISELVPRADRRRLIAVHHDRSERAEVDYEAPFRS